MDIMQAIMDIEQKAQGILDDTDELRANQEAILQQELQDKEQKTQECIVEQLKQAEFRIAADRQDEMERLESAYEKKLEALEIACQANQNKWIQQITQAIIAR